MKKGRSEAARLRLLLSSCARAQAPEQLRMRITLEVRRLSKASSSSKNGDDASALAEEESGGVAPLSESAEQTE